MIIFVAFGGSLVLVVICAFLIRAMRRRNRHIVTNTMQEKITSVEWEEERFFNDSI